MVTTVPLAEVVDVCRCTQNTKRNEAWLSGLEVHHIRRRSQLGDDSDCTRGYAPQGEHLRPGPPMN